MTHALRLPVLLLTLLSLTACKSIDVTFGEDNTVTDLRETYINSGAEGAEGILFWNVEQRRVGFKNIRDIYPTRLVEAGNSVLQLGSAPRDFSDLTYTVDGTTYTLADFAALPQNIGLLIIKDGDILLERYQDGNDRDDVWISFSVTKSITSLLIGAAIQDGFIQSVDDPVANYLPRLRGTGYEEASIRDVLQMSSGISWNEDYADPNSDVAKAGGANGIALVQYLAELPFENTPGEVFNYNTGETNLVGEILRAAIGNNAATYLEHKIWKPFGMGSDAYWNTGTEGGGELGGCCLNFTLRDYARIGLFMLADGKLADGTRVVPEGWIAQSTAPAESYPGYGYLWWLYGDGSYAAQGIFGQTIMIDPVSNSVVAMHSSAQSAVGSEYQRHRNAVMAALRARMRQG